LGSSAGWRGPFPDDINQITDEYLNEDINGYGPRCEWVDGATPLPAEEIVAAYNPLPAQKDKLKEMVRERFEQQSSAPVEISGVFYHGGMDSVLKIDGARRTVAEGIALGIISADTHVTITDVDNYPHEMSVEQATEVAVIIALAYQQAFLEKQALMVAIEEAATVEQLPTI
jgi:hypothetical protein